MKRTAIFLGLLIALWMGVVANSVSAQDRIQERYNQILEHLAGYLGLSSPIRFVDSWTWEEIVGTNAGFDCPVPGVTYPSSPNRYLKYIVNYQGRPYDYRVTGDGTILVLCGADGLPLARLENGVNVLPIVSADPPSLDSVPVVSALWQMWGYMPGGDRLTLFNQNGEVLDMLRPRLTNEVPFFPDVKMTISRDGRYLVQSTQVIPNTPVLTIYDFSTGSLRAIPLALLDTVHFGVGTFIFSPDSTSVAVGVARSDDPSVNEWRVMVINLATGNITTQITHVNIGAIMVSPSVEISQAIGGGFGSYFPRVFYWDNLGNIHFQLIYQFTGGAFTYPAISWNPVSNTATTSPYTRPNADLLPQDGSIIYSDNDPSRPAIPSMGMIDTQNVIRRGIPVGMVMTPQHIFHSPTSSMYSARWATNGAHIAFQYEDNVNPPRWGFFNIATPELPFTPLLPAYTHLFGVVNGFVTQEEGTDGFIFRWHQSGVTPIVVWNAPPMSGFPQIVWVQPFDTVFGLTNVVTTPTSITAPTLPPAVVGTPAPVPTSNIIVPPGATVLCAGAPPSIVRVGISARVTITNTGPLNVRQTASTSAPVSRIIPEGRVFTIIGGHQCADGYTWWQVRLDDGVVGWVAEGTTSQYFIEPTP